MLLSVGYLGLDVHSLQALRQSVRGKSESLKQAMCRAARYCHSSAHGGQILMPIKVAQDFVLFCSGKALSLEESSPPLRLGLLSSTASAYAATMLQRQSSNGTVRSLEHQTSRQAIKCNHLESQSRISCAGRRSLSIASSCILGLHNAS